MAYTSRIENGVAALAPPVSLPEGTKVRIEVQRPGAGFWNGKSDEELAREQGVPPITNIASMAIDWPEDESIEDFPAFIRKVRR